MKLLTLGLHNQEKILSILLFQAFTKRTISRQAKCKVTFSLNHKNNSVPSCTIFTNQKHYNHKYGGFISTAQKLYYGSAAEHTIDNEADITDSSETFDLPPPEFDWEYLCNPTNVTTITENVMNRKGVGNIYKVLGLWKAYQSETNTALKEELRRDLLQETGGIPNRTHPAVPIGDESQVNLMEMAGTKQEFDFMPKTVVELGEGLDAIRTSWLGHTTGPKTYYLKNTFAELEQALVRFTLDHLVKKGFLVVSVPDMLHPAVIEACGFNTTGEHTQVYRLDLKKHGNVCLAGTAEMSLAALHMNQDLQNKQLPIRLAATSRCYRAEVSNVKEEQGIYRVHQFTKVEMFGITANDTGKESENLFQEFVGTQKDLFSSLGLHFRILDMPTQELGAPAYRKFDIETWMPGKQFWGEISSTSNCTDFQSRRLHMKYQIDEGAPRHVHTVNGTACAIPRMITALAENSQNKDGSINVPAVLQPYMRGQDIMRKPEKPFKTKFIKSLKYS